MRKRMPLLIFAAVISFKIYQAPERTNLAGNRPALSVPAGVLTAVAVSTALPVAV